MAVAVERPARGVVYFEMADLMPGRAMFRCERMSASLQVTRCEAMWTEANGKGAVPERVERCLGCAVGAAHAGASDPSYHRLRGVGVCARCQRTDLRLIAKNICVGCQNRAYEWVKGRNAKGKFPAKHPPMAARRVAVAAGGVARVVRRELTVSTLELVVEVLRDSPQRAVFGFGIGRVYGQG